MKKLLNISIILLFSWQFIGTFIYFEVTSQCVKNDAQVIISTNNKKEIQILSFTPDEYKKIVWSGGKEFRYESNLYDVKNINRSSKNTLISCYLDQKEEKLIQRQSNIINLNNSNNKEKNSPTIVLKIIQTPFISNLEIIKISTFFLPELKEKQFFVYKMKNYFVALDPSYKPPINRV